MKSSLKPFSCFALLGFLWLLLPNVAKADSFAWTYEGSFLFVESVGTQINLYGDPFVTDPQLQYGVLTDSNDAGLGIFTVTPAAAVPEASTSTLLLVGALGLALAVIRNGLGRSAVNS